MRRAGLLESDTNIREAAMLDICAHSVSEIMLADRRQVCSSYVSWGSQIRLMPSFSSFICMRNTCAAARVGLVDWKQILPRQTMYALA